MKAKKVSVRSRALGRFLALSLATGLTLTGGALSSSVYAADAGLESSSLVFNGVDEDTSLRYASIEFQDVSEDGKQINLVLNKWAVGNTGWRNDDEFLHSGNVYLIFANPTFYNAIDSIVTNPGEKIGVISQERAFTKVESDGGKSYELSITDGKINYAAIGQNTSTNIQIRLNQSLTELGLQDTPVFFESFWTTDEGKIASVSMDQSYFVGNRNALNTLEQNSVDENFIGSDDRAMSKVLFDRLPDGSYVINNVQTWYPVENYKQSLNKGTSGVAYVKGTAPEFLLPYLEETVQIAGSDLNGNIHEDTVPAEVPLHEDGSIDLSDNPAYNVTGREKDWRDARDLGNENVFSAGNDGSPAGAVLGQSRSLTIRYRLKPDVDIAEFTEAVDAYVRENGPLVFSTWFEKATYEDTEESPSKYIQRSYSTSTFNGLDADGDGLLDVIEREYGTNPNLDDTDEDGYPDLEEILRGSDPTVKESIPYAETTISPKESTVVQGKALEVPVVITPPNDDVEIVVDAESLPEGLSYDPETKTLSGTPVVTNEEFGEAEEKILSIPVTIQNPDGTTQVDNILITVQRDTDQDGQPDVDDLDDDGDGTPDETDAAPKDATIPGGAPDEPDQPVVSKPTQTVVNGKPIESVVVTPAAADATVSVADENLPNGLTFDPTTKTLSGTPDLSADDFGAAETKEFDIPVTITDADGNKTTETITVTVQRDTDADGQPDVTDTDDDNDNVPDAQDIDPLDPTKGAAESDKPEQPTTPVISKPAQTVVDGKPIEAVVVTPAAADATVSVADEDLPNGLTFDPATKTLSGTPDLSADDFGAAETKEFDIPVTITDADGNKTTETITVTVQRDTDADGQPDVTDTDDDNDNVPDEQDIDPLDPAKGAAESEEPEQPAATVVSNAAQIVKAGEAIKDVVITPAADHATVSIDPSALPEGLAFDPNTNTLSGTLPESALTVGDGETQKFEIPVTITDAEGNKETQTITITVQRDLDANGNPDVSDPDNDGDGIEDGNDLNPSEPADETQFHSGSQTVVDGQPIQDVVLAPKDEGTIEFGEGEELPAGVTLDPETNTLTGTPELGEDFWANTKEDTFAFVLNPSLVKPDGESTEPLDTLVLTVQRDTDGDGQPDITDTDDDGDGVADSDDVDPKDATVGAVPEPGTPGTTTPTSPISHGTQTAVNGKALPNAIVITPAEKATVTVDESALPNGVTFDPNTNTISGTPNVAAEDFADGNTKEFDIPVTIKNADGTETIETVTITVQLDTDKDGEPDLTDDDDDNDGVLDGEDIAPKDPTKGAAEKPEVTPLISHGTQTAVNGKALPNAIVITPAEGETVTVDTSALPNGVTYNPETKTISGTPNVAAEDFGEGNTKEFDIVVTFTDADGNAKTETVTITVQRDTDGDGEPDLTDSDDDNDGTLDENDIAPKDPSKGAADTDGDGIPDVDDTDDDGDGVPDVDDVAPKDATKGAQTVVNGQPISPVVVTPAAEGATVSVNADDLPEGLEFDEETGTLSGTLNLSAEEFGDNDSVTIEIPVTITNPDGTQETKKLILTVQRDTDGDGIPDGYDHDDDGDGILDDKDSDPKDPNKGANGSSSKPVDTDGDGIPDENDHDDDGDGILDDKDSDPKDPNKGANGSSSKPVDTDGDGIPDENDHDDDGDGILDDKDSDPKDPNKGANGSSSKPGNTDGDDIPDGNDHDDDGDDILDDKDSDSKEPNKSDKDTEGGQTSVTTGNKGEGTSNDKENTDGVKANTPKTGDISLLPILASGMASAAALFVMRRKRK